MSEYVMMFGPLDLARIRLALEIARDAFRNQARVCTLIPLRGTITNEPLQQVAKQFLRQAAAAERIIARIAQEAGI